MKKKFCFYLPAELKTQAKRWYIEYYVTDPVTERLTRMRRTFGLNRIKKKRLRKKIGLEIVQEINNQLETEYTAETVKYMTVRAAVNYACSIKCSNTNKDRTKESYRSTSKIFLEWIEKNKLGEKNISLFTKDLANRFLNHRVMVDGIGNKTFNINKGTMSAIFAALVDDGYIKTNPWQGVKPRKIPKKNRRAFSVEEARKAAKYIYENDYWLFMAILLEMYCFIRPSELRKLKFENFKLDVGIVEVSADIEKHGRDKWPTIPDAIKHFFLENRWQKWPSEWLVFGRLLLPHPDKSVGRNTMNVRHGKIMQKLEREGNIKEAKNLTMYSWKDTGITIFSKLVNPVSVKDQANHSSLDITMKYYHRKKVNTEMKGLDDILKG